jgi:hypothetical protein
MKKAAMRIEIKRLQAEVGRQFAWLRDERNESDRLRDTIRMHESASEMDSALINKQQADLKSAQIEIERLEALATRHRALLRICADEHGEDNELREEIDRLKRDLAWQAQQHRVQCGLMKMANEQIHTSDEKLRLANEQLKLADEEMASLRAVIHDLRVKANSGPDA